MKLIKNKTYHIKELIDMVKNKSDRDFDIYGKEKYIPENNYHIYIAKVEILNENSVVFVGDSIKIDEDDNEIYPNEVLENNTEPCYSCENFQDVIDLAFEQKGNASTSEFIKCLNYFNEKDTFFDLS